MEDRMDRTQTQGYEEISGGPEGKEESLFDRLKRQSQEGEKLIDPRCGKHENAILSFANAAQGESGYLRVDMEWGNLMDTNGQVFSHTDRLFLPNQDTHAISKLRFMTKLKALGVVPQNFQNMLYFTTYEEAEGLAEAIRDACAGQEFPITISLDNRGYYNVSVRRRRKIANGGTPF